MNTESYRTYSEYIYTMTPGLTYILNYLESVHPRCMTGLILPGEKMFVNNRGHSSSILPFRDFHFTPNLFDLVCMPLLPAATVSLDRRRSVPATIKLIKKKEKKPMELQSSDSGRLDLR